MDRTSARVRLEDALLSSDLCNEDRVRVMVNKAFQAASDGSRKSPWDKQVLESRFREVWRFLSELRGVGVELAKDSAVVDDIEGKGWKVKEDTGTMRVLYKKGPEGTPLHTMCLEGFINGPLATALCVAWEAPYFKDWWPQFTVPTFRITHSQWIDQAKPGQVIASVRFKVAWPFAPREIVLEAYAVEYWAKDILIVLMKTLPPGPSPLSQKGPSIPPEEKGVTRMEVVGGYIFQQISPSQCYFRTIADIDLKLALVPAWVINFISRQLAGLGLKLFEKVVQDVTSAKDTKFVKVFQRLLETDPFLQQVKAGLASPECAEPSQRNGMRASNAVGDAHPDVHLEGTVGISGAGLGSRVENDTIQEAGVRVRQEAGALSPAASTSKAGRETQRNDLTSGRIDGYERAEEFGREQAGLGASTKYTTIARSAESSSTYTSARQSLVQADNLGIGQYGQEGRVGSGLGTGHSGLGDGQSARAQFEVGTGLSAAELSEREDGTSPEVKRCAQVIDKAVLRLRARKGKNVRSEPRDGGNEIDSGEVSGHRVPASQVGFEGDVGNSGSSRKDGVTNRVQRALDTLDRALRLCRKPETG